MSSEVRIENVILPAAGGTVCIRFAYLKYEVRGHQPVPLTMSLKVTDGRNVGPSVQLTENAKDRMQEVEFQAQSMLQPMLMQFSVSVPRAAAGQVTVVALDNVRVTAGPCPPNGK